MAILRRLLAFLISVAMLAGVVYLGLRSGKDASFVVWFGLASAIAAPVALSLLTYAFAPGNRDVIERLAKIPEIEKLVREADSQEEKIHALEAERERLVEIVKLESRRHAIADRTESLEHDAVRILHELENLDKERKLLDEEVGESPARDEIRHLEQRVRVRDRGDVVLRFGSQVFAINRDIVKAVPFGFGNISLALLRILERLLK